VTDIFISYLLRERELILPLKQRLDALGLTVFEDGDRRLDECSRSPETLTESVRAAKAVLGCWSPKALACPWVQAGCAIAMEEDKLVATQRLALSPSQVPALFKFADRKPLIDFVEDQPHEGWAATLEALAAKLRLWAERRPSQPETADAIAKAVLLETAAAAERASLAEADGLASARVTKPAAATIPRNPVAEVWAAIEEGLQAASYRPFEQTVETPPAACDRHVETEARGTKGRRAAGAQARPRRDAAPERHRHPVAAEASRKVADEQLTKSCRAAQAASAGRPVAERAFAIELPGVASWPSPKMIAIPPGRSFVGAPASEERSSERERPQHEVWIAYASAMGEHTVTFAEWDAARAAGAKLEPLNDGGWGRGRRPVINVSWQDAQAYLAWLNETVGLIGQPDAYRLPNEAEWEYACRAGTTTPFSCGATISTAQANYDGNHNYGAGKKGEYRGKTTPVGAFPANPFGLYDMHGNVWEWCQDCWNDTYNGAPSDGSAWTAGDCTLRVLRGGSWGSDPGWLRCADRDWDTSSSRLNNRGFRLARTILFP
jgi:formylglycine-generating enzyme required for sulfatase activity